MFCPSNGFPCGMAFPRQSFLVCCWFFLHYALRWTYAHVLGYLKSVCSKEEFFLTLVVIVLARLDTLTSYPLAWFVQLWIEESAVVSLKCRIFHD